MDSCTCLRVSVREDGKDDTGNYKMVFKLQHNGHQSYGQSFTAEFAEGFSVVELPGDIRASVSGKELHIERDNQLNDNGLTEIWIKLAAAEQPKVKALRDFACKETKDGEN